MENQKPKKVTNEQEGLKKAEHYCAYQERSQQETRDKLYDWGLWPEAVENIISQLISSNFLNEERFAKAYSKGKFNQKGWGKIKIKQGLKFKQVPDVLIKKALATIDMDNYLQTLETIISKKAALTTEKDTYKRNYKLQQYAMGRGYEADLVADVLKNREL